MFNRFLISSSSFLFRSYSTDKVCFELLTSDLWSRLFLCDSILVSDSLATKWSFCLMFACSWVWVWWVFMRAPRPFGLFVILLMLISFSLALLTERFLWLLGFFVGCFPQSFCCIFFILLRVLGDLTGEEFADTIHWWLLLFKFFSAGSDAH